MRGKKFNITSETQNDQKYIHGRNIFDNVAVIVDRIFNNYVRRQGFKEPYFTEYCNGSTHQCPGLKQWGTVALANQGYTPIEILRYYYPKDIQIVECNLFQGITESYPGSPMRLGDSGEYIRVMQLFLNRISTDFPLVKPIRNPNGVFGTDTEQAVKVFQRTFNMSSDGIIGRATWNEISRVYGAVKKLSELNGEGERIGIGASPPTVTLQVGAKGPNVAQLQFLLNYISAFYPTVPPVLETSVFDMTTQYSVIEFQREFGLTTDGVVGKGTWNMLYEVYKGIIGNAPHPPPSTSEDYPGTPLRLGSGGNDVRLIQTYLNAISDVFPAIPKVVVDGAFGPATDAQVRAYQSLFGLTVDGVVGASTWNSIIDQFHFIGGEYTYPGTALRIGSRGNDVQKIQRWLNSIRTRYPSIPQLSEDGVFGEGTAASVKEFQRLFRLSVDGVVGKNTWDAIVKEYRNPTYPKRPVYPGTPLRVGSRGEDVRIMQDYLNSLSSAYPGIPRIAADGIYGEGTANAVRAFQRTFGLVVDGVIGANTWQTISDAYWNLTGRSSIISAMGRALFLRTYF